MEREQDLDEVSLNYSHDHFLKTDDRRSSSQSVSGISRKSNKWTEEEVKLRI
jgi:hypothetical protein